MATSVSNFNKMLERLLPYLMNTKMMQDRMRGYRGLETQRQEGARSAAEALAERRRGEETTRHQNTLVELQQKFTNAVAQMEPIKSKVAEIRQFNMMGKPTEALEANLNKEVNGVAKTFIGPALGGNVPEVGAMGNALKTLTDTTTRSLLEGIGKRQEYREKYVKEIGPKMGIERQKAATEAGKLSQQTRGDYYKTFMKPKIDHVLTFLKGLRPVKETGVAGPPVSGSADMMDIGLDMIQNMIGGEQAQAEALLGGAITRPNLAKLMSRLERLDTKAFKTGLTDKEEEFIDRAYDIFGAQETLSSEVSGMGAAGAGAAPVIPEASVGATPASAADVETEVQQLKARIIQLAFEQNKVITPEEADRLAREAIKNRQLGKQNAPTATIQ